jgi:hypothetical protein
MELQVESINNEYILVKIPIDSLIDTQEQRQDIPLRVTDRSRMISWIRENLSKWDNKEDGSTAFTRFLDDMLTEAYATGECWLEGVVAVVDEIEIE